jgi:hypothetical protein
VLIRLDFIYTSITKYWLIIIDANKPIINQLNVIPLIIPYLEKDSAPPLQFGTVGVLKHLTSKNGNSS